MIDGTVEYGKTEITGDAVMTLPEENLCLNNNNLFGLYNSSRGRYHRFDHWTESVIAYKVFIQRRYKPPENYYKFLQRIGYAGDPNYISKLKKVVNKNDTRRSE